MVKSLVICVVVVGVSEVLLLNRLVLGNVDAILLAIFGTACTGMGVFGKAFAERKMQKSKKEKQEDG